MKPTSTKEPHMCPHTVTTPDGRVWVCRKADHPEHPTYHYMVRANGETW